MEAERSCYGGGQFKRGTMVNVTEAAYYFKGNGPYGSGQFKGGTMVHVTEVVSLKEGKWSCYRGG